MSASTQAGDAVDRFAVPPAEATAAARTLAGAIRSGGPIPFSQFMQTALYHPQHGYYRRGQPTVGRDGDFLTSPEVHPLFGYALASVAASVWDALGRPQAFHFRDVGPGTGALAEAVLTWTAAQNAAFAEALVLELVEPSASATALQRRRLASFSDRVRWHATLAAASPAPGLTLGNELLDAQPVHRLRWNGSAWEELYVGLDEAGQFTECMAPLRDAGLAATLANVDARCGQTVEVCPGLETLVASLAETVSRGMLLLFDYGYGRKRLYAPWRIRGTLMTFYRQTPGEDALQRVGEQDLTCHVDLDAVEAAAVAVGLRRYAVRSQAEFLADLGALTTASMETGVLGSAMDVLLSRKRAAAMLADPGGLGRISVMAFGRDLAAAVPGFEWPP